MSLSNSSEMFDLLSENPINNDWKSATGEGVSIAVIDSGVDRYHQDLRGKIKHTFEANNDGKKIIFKESDIGDSAGHGTACAGIISKIAPDAELSSIKVLGAGGLGGGHAFLAGLEFAIKRRFKIVNLSLGTTKPQFIVPLHDLIDRAYKAGCIIVSAGNNLPQPSYPSIFCSSLIAAVSYTHLTLPTTPYV